MLKVSNRIEQLPLSATLKMAQVSRELKAQGVDIIDLSIGQPDFDTPQHIKDAAVQAIADGYTNYTPVNGFLDLREAIVHKLKRDNGLDYTVEQIVVSTGAKQSIANMCLCLLNPGDEVILPAPYWVSYAAAAQLAEAKIVEVPTALENQFKITPEQLKQNITPKTKLIIISTPGNPTGSIYTQQELEALADVLVQHPQVIFASDEIYEHINFEGNHASMACIDKVKDQVVTINGCSKGFAMTGWRIGYLAAPEWLAKACTKMQGQFTSGTCSIAQKAAIAALGDDLEPTKAMTNVFKDRMAIIDEALKEMPGVDSYQPAGAFYFFPDVSSFFGKSYDQWQVNNSDDLSLYLLESANVALVTGAAFGAPNCIRIAYANSTENIVEAMSRIKTALANLQ